VIPILSEVRWRELLPGQVSRVCAVTPESGEVRVVYESSTSVLEAPNWMPDGTDLLVNSAGSLYRLAADGSGEPRQVDSGALRDINNDHVVSPDGTTIYVSSEADGHLYALPADGGEPSRLSSERPGPFGYFVLGVSPDGSTLAFTGAEPRGSRPFVGNLHTMPATGGFGIQLTDWDADSVGSAFSADGTMLYFSSELGGVVPGHTQLYRMALDGSYLQQLTFDDRVNWFPKPSPDGKYVAWVSFRRGTVGHEANVPVQLRVMRPDGSGQRTLIEVFGGQGTMNVTSWSPDGSEFAFVDYPIHPRQ
jgi:TolB protein